MLLKAVGAAAAAALLSSSAFAEGHSCGTGPCTPSASPQNIVQSPVAGQSPAATQNQGPLNIASPAYRPTTLSPQLAGQLLNYGPGTVQSASGPGGGAAPAGAAASGGSAGGGLGGGASPAAAGGPSAAAAAATGGRAVGSNPNWAPSDLQKLQGSGEASGPGPAPAPATERESPAAAAASRAFLGRSVADLSGGRSARDTTAGGNGLASSALNKLRMGDFRGAVADGLKAIDLEPANPEGYLRAAEGYNHLKDYGEAEKTASASLERGPTNAEAWKNLAWAQIKEGKYADALQSAQAAVKLDPGRAESLALAAYAASHLGDRAAAEKYLASAAQLDPRFQGKLQDAKNGGTILEDENLEDDPTLFDAGKSARRSAGLPVSPAAAGAGAAGLAALGGGAWWWLRRRRAVGPEIRLAVPPPAS